MASAVPIDREQRHDAVIHPAEILKRLDGKRIMTANDWLAHRLGAVFGSVWLIWAFLIWPLVANHLGVAIQNWTSYYAQSWIQLFALPLFVYIGNKLQKADDAQADAMHQALTHIATVEDQNSVLIQQNTTLTAEVHALVLALSGK